MQFRRAQPNRPNSNGPTRIQLLSQPSPPPPFCCSPSPPASPSLRPESLTPTPRLPAPAQHSAAAHGSKGAADKMGSASPPREDDLGGRGRGRTVAVYEGCKTFSVAPRFARFSWQQIKPASLRSSHPQVPMLPPEPLACADGCFRYLASRCTPWAPCGDAKRCPAHPAWR